MIGYLSVPDLAICLLPRWPTTDRCSHPIRENVRSRTVLSLVLPQKRRLSLQSLPNERAMDSGRHADFTLAKMVLNRKRRTAILIVGRGGVAYK